MDIIKNKILIIIFILFSLITFSVQNGLIFESDESGNMVQVEYINGIKQDKKTIFYESGIESTFYESNNLKYGNARYKLLNGDEIFIDFGEKNRKISNYREEKSNEIIQIFLNTNDYSIVKNDIEKFLKVQDKYSYLINIILIINKETLSNSDLDYIASKINYINFDNKYLEIELREYIDEILMYEKHYFKQYIDNLSRISELYNGQNLDVSYRLYEHFKNIDSKKAYKYVLNILDNPDYDYNDFYSFYNLLKKYNASKKYFDKFNEKLLYSIQENGYISSEYSDYIFKNLQSFRLSKNEELNIRYLLNNSFSYDDSNKILNLEQINKLEKNNFYIKRELLNYYINNNYTKKSINMILEIMSNTNYDYSSFMEYVYYLESLNNTIYIKYLNNYLNKVGMTEERFYYNVILKKISTGNYNILNDINKIRQYNYIIYILDELIYYNKLKVKDVLEKMLKNKKINTRDYLELRKRYNLN